MPIFMCQLPLLANRSEHLFAASSQNAAVNYTTRNTKTTPNVVCDAPGDSNRAGEDEEQLQTGCERRGSGEEEV